MHLVARIHPDDARPFRETVAWAMESGNDCEMEFRWVRPEGGFRRLYTRAKLFRDRDGRLAHDFNNMLTAINGYTDDARLNKPFPPASMLEKVRELLNVTAPR